MNENLMLNKYVAHLKLGGFGLPGQEALANASVLIIGSGELAIPVLTYLTSMGVGSIGIVDSGLISIQTLPMQPLFRYNQVGQSRIHLVAQHIRGLNPHCKVETYEDGLTVANVLEVISRYTVVVDATNSMEAGYLINDACVILGIPLIVGYIHRYEGQFTVLNFKAGATLRCLIEDSRLKNHLPNDESEGVLGILPGIIGSYMANEVVKIAAGIGDVVANKLVIINALKSNLQTIDLLANPKNQQISTLQQAYNPLQTESSDLEIQSIKPHQLVLKLSYQESIQLIDIREKTDWDNFHIDKSIHLPASEILTHLDKIHQDIPVILISNDGKISRHITVLLTGKYGYGNIYSLLGGINAWSKEIGQSKPGS